MMAEWSKGSGRWRVEKQAGRKERDRGITEDGASVAALMCGRWVDRVAELWL